jgi:hypothetical protein
MAATKEQVKQSQHKKTRHENNVRWHITHDVDPVSKAAGCNDLKFFLSHYFPQAFSLEWSPDHLKVISTLERNILSGGLMAIAMPRGSGKTTMFRYASLWAILYGHRQFVALIGANASAAGFLIEGLKSTLSYNTLLINDFQREIKAFALLENNSHKAQYQRYGETDDGSEPTNIGWGSDEIVFPNIPGSPCSGFKIAAYSIEGGIRGIQHVLPDGTIIRPDLVLIDDPQTRESAKSPSQTELRLKTLNGDILYLPAPGVKVSGLLTCTVIYENDLAHQLLDRKKNPDWQGQKMQALYSKPERMDLWDKYWQLRSESLQADGDGSEATEYYKQNRGEMDKGARVAWEARHNPDEISALQHIMNLYYRDPETFAAEYQNEPTAKQDEEVILKPADVIEHVNGRPRFEIPLKCNRITMFVDVHDEILFYVVAAWEDDFTGYIVDYGTFPEQNRLDFNQKNPPMPLSKLFKGLMTEALIQRGLETLIDNYLKREWKRAGGALMKIERLLVDSGYKPGIVENVRHKMGAVMMASRGLPITAAKKPISAYQKKPGERIGFNWYIPNVSKTREFPYVGIDVNYWKSFVHQQIAMNSLTLWGNRPAEHRLFAEHIANSETFVVTTGNGRTVREWKIKPNRPDNHWFDCLVGCCVGASMLGVTATGQASATKERKVIKLSEIQKQKRNGK